MTVVKIVNVLSSLSSFISDEIPLLKEIERLNIDSSENRYINPPMNRRMAIIIEERYFDRTVLLFLYFDIDYTAYGMIIVTVGSKSDSYLK